MEYLINLCFSWGGIGYLAVGIILITLLKLYFNGPKANKVREMSGEIVIVTGATGGIGKETALQLLKDGCKVIFACRNKEKTEEVINNIKNPEERKRALFIELNLEDFQSIKNFVENFKKKDLKIDILVNNAASLYKNFKLLENGIEQTLGVNVIGPIILTQLLLPFFNKNARIINVSSKGYQRVKYNPNLLKQIDPKTYNFEPENYSGWPNYFYSKLGNIYFTQYLTRYIENKSLNLKSASLHPGVIPTELMRDYNSIFIKIIFLLIYPLFFLTTKTLWRGAQTTLHLCYLNYSDLSPGNYYSDCAIQKLMPHADNIQSMESYMNLIKGLINHYGKSNEVEFTLN